mmetsp:Transcript_6905/g.10135  ORF Transcript_6905/g.10135 Transcript_6905/m.10135 type:complete len:127 (+) Transcript_6905:114-494(+)
MEGVERVVVGYTGGQEPNPTYQSIKDSTEAVLIEYDPSVISYEEILNEWVKQHHPFMMQKCQYRSAIWVKNDKERGIATQIVEDLFVSSGQKVYTEIENINPFYRAEEYHQDFLNKQRTGAGAWVR